MTSDATAPLWRAAAAFRIGALAYVISQQVMWGSHYTERRLSWVLIALLVAWSGVSSILLMSGGALRGRVRRWHVVLADQVVVVALMWSTRLVAPFELYHERQTLPTTLWAASAVVSAAVLRGPVGGVASALLITLTNAAVREHLDDLWDEVPAQMIAVGLTVGVATRTVVRAQEKLEHAARLSAATAERERLARHVHDGVLQVLAYVKRRGNEIGGPTAELATMAGEQEHALRQLIAGRGQADSGGASTDLRPLLTALAGPSVSVSAPGEPVEITRAGAREITAAVSAALSNVTAHAGPEANAYVLLEDTGDEVIVSVRDDGPGIPAGRLTEAETEGRMGVCKSIRGRIHDIGGSATLLTAPGEGTEWEFTIPYREERM